MYAYAQYQAALKDPVVYIAERTDCNVCTVAKNASLAHAKVN
jgi:hypothetical protein